ncbi:type II 3-dehydroquinate dehydratase [Desulfovibrio inopinatus]|uniref:type II 3-dehydroquinate dehydratase n=1 Tax=Desulfovibrio inopinatus TaxID=102109 RepID=UPI00040F3EA4|nr:type II 3-dehydroquinate dehydratase [Desulfovibrio inopinatus]
MTATQASKRFLVLNGPNLGHIGTRQPEIYGTATMEDLPGLLRTLMGETASHISLTFFQANGEGALIDRLEKARKEGIDGIIFNAGAYTHTSLALADCLAWIKIPCVEVHISNIWARTDEPLRQRSFIGKNCLGVIAGFGVTSYALAAVALWQHLTDTADSN